MLRRKARPRGISGTLAVEGPDLDEVVEEGRPAAHVGEGGGSGAVDVGRAGAELVPVDAGRDGEPGPDGVGQGDAGPEGAAIVVDLGPMALGEAATLGVLARELDGRVAGDLAMVGRVGEGRVEELGT